MSTDPKIKIVIPFRLRESGDPRRSANLEVVLAWWWMHGLTPTVVSDGRSGDEQFNRHRAYNKAVRENPDTDVFVFTEADMLIPPKQILEAVRQAVEAPGLVVPFTQYRYLSDDTTALVREEWADENTLNSSIMALEPESTMEGGRSIGAVNVFSRATIERVGGFTEATEGNWYDDNIVEEAYAYLAGATRWVEGPAVHMYHLPGHKGDHLSLADQVATAHNKRILGMIRGYIRQDRSAAVKAAMMNRSAR